MASTYQRDLTPMLASHDCNVKMPGGLARRGFGANEVWRGARAGRRRQQAEWGQHRSAAAFCPLNLADPLRRWKPGGRGDEDDDATGRSARTDDHRDGVFEWQC